MFFCRGTRVKEDREDGGSGGSGGGKSGKSSQVKKEQPYNPLYLDEAEYEQVKEEAARLLENAQAAEPEVTATLEEIAKKHGARLAGLDHRLKTYESLLRKAVGEVEWRRELLVSGQGTASGDATTQGDAPTGGDKEDEGDDKPDAARKGTSNSSSSSNGNDGEQAQSGGEAASGSGDGAADDQKLMSIHDMVQCIGDSLRYTMVPAFDAYKATVDAAMEALLALNMTLVRSKNYWSEGDHYQGLNMTLKHPAAGVMFELQFHTEQGLKIKKECHKLYKKYRVEKSPFKKKKYFDQGCKLANKVRVPPGALGIDRVMDTVPPDPIELMADDLRARALHAQPTLDAAVLPLLQSLQPAKSGRGEDVKGARTGSSEVASRNRLMSEIEEHLEATKTKDVEGGSAAVTDVLRYHAVAPAERYVEEVQRVTAELAKMSSVKPRKLQNFWAHGDAYQGLHAPFVYESKRTGKVPFEVRFHTPETWNMLRGRMAEFLSNYNALTPQERTTNYEALLKEWAKLPVPEGVMNLKSEKLLVDMDELVQDAQ